MTPLRLRSRRTAFTMIELLVVTSIIIILMSLAFPAFQAVQNSAKKTQAKNDLVQIVTAVNAFYMEYGRYPTAETTDAKAKFGPGFASSAAVLSELRATTNALNTRRIVFFSPPEDTSQATPKGKIGNTGQWFDPWASEYSLQIDADYDNQVSNPYGPASDFVRQGAIAWSLGKNGRLGGGATTDNQKFSSETGSAGDLKGSGDVISWQ